MKKYTIEICVVFALAVLFLFMFTTCQAQAQTNPHAPHYSNFGISWEYRSSLNYRNVFATIVRVKHVKKNSPAETAGIQEGDVLSSINDANVLAYSPLYIGLLLLETKSLHIELFRRNKGLFFFSFEAQHVR